MNYLIGSAIIAISIAYLIVRYRHDIVRFIRENGWVRALLFMPVWIIIAGLTQGIGIAGYFTIATIAGGVDMTDPLAAEAIFAKISFDSPMMLLLVVFGILGSFLSLWFMMTVVNRQPLASIGLSTKNRGKEMLAGLAGALLFIAGIFLILWLIGAITVTGFVGFKPGVFIVSMVLFLAAFDEELIFRGYILNNMMDSTDNRWIALAGSSLLFAGMHAQNQGVFSTFVPMSELFAAGFILGISYTFTKNLWFPTFFHFGWNFFQGLFGFKISGFNVDSWKLIAHNNTLTTTLYNDQGNILKDQDIPGMVNKFPDIISGGVFGIEGTVISLCCTILGTYFIWKYYIDNE